MPVRRVVIAPDKFKGSAGAGRVAAALARGFRSVLDGVDIVEIPMADGGEGTVAAFLDAGASAVRAQVHDALGRPLVAEFALDGSRAVLEMATAVGLRRLRPFERDPWRADSAGLGELILAALDAGAQSLVIGIGGSATMDAGIGLLRALGARTEPPMRLHGIESIDLSGIDRRLREVRIDVACDVDNPLCGPTGAANVFAAQRCGPR